MVKEKHPIWSLAVDFSNVRCVRASAIKMLWLGSSGTQLENRHRVEQAVGVVGLFIRLKLRIKSLWSKCLKVLAAPFRESY